MNLKYSVSFQHVFYSVVTAHVHALILLYVISSLPPMEVGYSKVLHCRPKAMLYIFENPTSISH